MKHTRTLVPIAALALSVGLLAGCAPAQSASPDAKPAATPTPSASASPADEMFAAMMLEHHQQAIDMSDLVLAKSGVDPRVTALAERIKAAQGPEIERMTGWLETWGVDPTQGTHSMGHDDGMMSEEDLAALETADGAAASKLFLEQMIEHHLGAVDMAEAEYAVGSHADAVKLAEQIIDDQQAEIEEMRTLLTELG